MSDVVHNPVATFAVNDVIVHEAHGHNLVEIQSNVGFAKTLEMVLKMGGAAHNEISLHVVCPCGTDEVLCRVHVSAETLRGRLERLTLEWQHYKAGTEPTMDTVVEAMAREITEVASKRLAIVRQLSWLRLFLGELPRTTIFRVQ